MHYSLFQIMIFYIWCIYSFLLHIMNKIHGCIIPRLEIYTIFCIFNMFNLVWIFILSLGSIISLIWLLIKDYWFFAIFIFKLFKNLFIVTIQFYNLIYHVNKYSYHQTGSIRNHANLYIDQNYSQIYRYFLSCYWLEMDLVFF